MFRPTLLALLMIMPFSAQAEVAVPSLRAPVTDQAGILSRSAVERLNGILRSLSENTSTQLAVLTLPTTDGEPIEAFSIRVADQWKLGQAKSDRGVLLVIAMRDRKMRIEVGQGLEGDLPDAYARRIVDQMAPAMRAGQYDQAIEQAVVGILERVEPKFLESGETKDIRRAHPARGLGSYLTLIFLALFLALSSLARMSRYGRRRSVGSSIFWGGVGGGLGGGWGGGGGGFGGGGGGFSGGGSSGSW